MSLYRKYDLVMIISSFRTKFHEEFYYAKDKRSSLEDIFYIVENPISVNGKLEEGYSIMFYFKNGISITPKNFCLLNGIKPVYHSFASVNTKTGK